MRFLTLDGLRGVAALAVVIFHADVLLHGQYAPSGFLAVDFFFLLSGFVIAHAYDDRIEGIGLLAFIRRRVIRFYPLYLLGLCLGAAWLAAELILRPPAYLTAGEGARDFLLGLVFLPSPGKNLYPLNVPAWSLGCELLINILFAVFHRRLTGSRLLAVVLLSGAALALGWTGTVHEGGWLPLVRATFGFSLGVLLFRSRFRWSANPWLLVAVTALALLFPAPKAWGGLYELACVFVLFPLVVAGGVRQPRLEAPFAWAGDASYTIYAIHYPLIWMVAVLHGPPWIAFVFIAALMAATGPLQRFYDRPARHWLSSLAAARPTAALADATGG
jgi:peptidoglycan/LPS O-acetylase OafA/YrhL